MGWLFDDPPKKPEKKKGFWDSLFEPERRKLDKKPMNRENEGHTLTPEQVEDLRLIQNNAKNKEKGWFDW